MNLRWAVILLGLAAMVSAGCTGDPSDREIDYGQASQALIRDTAHSGQIPGFFFLPPFIQPPKGQTFGAFAPAANPTVTIDQIVPSTASSTTPQIIKSKVAVFTVSSGPPLVDRRNRRTSERVRVHLANRGCDPDDDDGDADAESYFAIRWDTREANLVDGGVYRLHVQVPVLGNARELGFADIIVLRKAAKARFVDTTTEVPLVNNRVLRVKFRIDTPALDPCVNVVCGAADQCHAAGQCDRATGVCSNPSKPNGTACSDGSACTQADTCQAGACVGQNPVVCGASDQCHGAGVCDPSSGACSNPAKVDGTVCSDGDACTQTDACQAGACVGAGAVVCTALDPCHLPGVCDSLTGVCSNPASTSSACTGGTGGGGTVPTSGGTVTTELADVTVPAQAALSPLDVSVTPMAAPATLPSGVSAVGSAIDIELGTGQAAKLNAPVIIRLKYPSFLVHDPSKLGVLHFNGTAYEPTTVLGEDPQNGTLTIETRTFSPFQIVDFSGMILPDSASVGFSASTNGWNIQNFGSYFDGGGNCLGMSAYASWFFTSEASVNLNGHYSGLGTPSIAQLVATRAHLAQSQYWALQSSTYLHTLGDARTATLMKFYLAAFGEPLVLLLAATPGNPSHASVVYGYDQTGFTFYDVNVPDTQQTVSWNGTAWGTYLTYRNFSFVAAPSFGRTEDFGALTAEAEGGFSSSSALTITNPTPGSQIPQTQTTLSGTVSGINGAARIVAFVKGVREDLPIASGAFSGLIPVASGENTVIVLAGIDISAQSNWYLNAATRVFSVTGTQPQTRLLATLTWDQTASDVDLYGTDPNGATAWYASKSTSSGLQLDFDNVTGLGPEHTTLTMGSTGTVLAGDYVLRVHYYADHSGSSPTQPITGTVTVVVNEGQPNQQVSSFHFGVNVANSSNATPGANGPDWVNIAKVNIVNSTISAL
jgi:uncharacterized protein YfaP (DUF2135 family)